MSELSIQFWFIGPPREEPESLRQLFILTDFPSAFRQKQKGDTAAIISFCTDSKHYYTATVIS